MVCGLIDGLGVWGVAMIRISMATTRIYLMIGIIFGTGLGIGGWGGGC